MTKEIQLNHGKVALVDDEDFEELNKYKWYAHKMRGDLFYAYRRKRRIENQEGNRGVISMHKMLISDAKEIDHKNGNSLDNRKENLRGCSHSQNIANSKTRTMYGSKNKTSFFRGVNWSAQRKKWRARVCKNYKVFELGFFNDQLDAAKAYDKKSKELFGDFARLNFSEE